MEDLKDFLGPMIDKELALAYDEGKHPRGRFKNKGQYRGKGGMKKRNMSLTEPASKEGLSEDKLKSVLKQYYDDINDDEMKRQLRYPMGEETFNEIPLDMKVNQVLRNKMHMEDYDKAKKAGTTKKDVLHDYVNESPEEHKARTERSYKGFRELMQEHDDRNMSIADRKAKSIGVTTGEYEDLIDSYLDKVAVFDSEEDDNDAFNLFYKRLTDKELDAFLQEEDIGSDVANYRGSLDDNFSPIEQEKMKSAFLRMRREMDQED